MGWERPNWFAGVGKTPDMQYGWGRGAWFDAVAAEHRATREAVTVVDETSFGKILVQGRDAEAALQRLCGQRHRRAGRPHGLYRHPERARHLRERSHHRAGWRATSS